MVANGDITALDLEDRFDLVIAPFRVLQALESDRQVDGLFQSLRSHMAPGARSILNAFQPKLDPESMRTAWVSQEERLAWEVETPTGRVACFDRRTAIDEEELILYPELIYRRYQGDELVEELTHPIVMRCYYPDDLIARIETEGFRVTNMWGGYAGEIYGAGSELVVEFEQA